MYLHKNQRFDIVFAQLSFDCWGKLNKLWVLEGLILSFQPITEEIAIMRQFTFASSLQRMSVITRKLGAPNFELFSKGAPEMIASLSKPETCKNILWLAYNLIFLALLKSLLDVTFVQSFLYCIVFVATLCVIS